MSVRAANLLGWGVSALLYLAASIIVAGAILPAPVDWSRPWTWAVILLWPLAALAAIGAFLGGVALFAWLLSLGDRR